MTEGASAGFFDEGEGARGPQVSDVLIARAERTLGVRLPRAYLDLLTEQNGGRPRRRCCPTAQRTCWGPDRIEVESLVGIGYDGGLDGRCGSAYMVHEWDYPDIGLVVFDTPSGGHDTVMLDYSACGPEGEPQVVYVDDDRNVLPVADSFAAFVAKLVDCAALPSMLDA